MLAALLCVALFLSVLVGWGALVERALFEAGTGPDSAALRWEWPALGLAGVCALTALGLFCNLFMPLDARVTLPVVVVGAFSLLWHRERWLAPLRLRGPKALAVPALLLAACTALGLLHGSEYDTGLYHLPVVLWAHQSAVPLGLANLYPAYGNNSAWLVFASMLWVPGLELRGPFCVNMVAFVLALGALLTETRTRSRPTSTLALLALAALAFSTDRFAVYQGGSPATDAAGLLLIPLALALAPGVALARGAAQFERRASLLCLCSALAVVTKLATLPLLLLLPLAWLARRRRTTASPLPLRAAFAGAALVGLWMARSVATSGCLLFPVVQTCTARLPWSAPEALTREHAQVLLQWTRGHSSAAGTFGWVRDWLELVSADRIVVSMTALALLSSAALLVELLRSGGRPLLVALAPYAGPLLVSLAGLALWLVGAPDPRLSYGFIVGAPLCLLAMALAGLRLRRVRRAAARWVRFASLASLGMQGLVAALMLAASPGLSWPEIPDAIVGPARAADGTPITLALEPAGPGAQCWSAPQPCTPALRPGLRVTRLLGRPAFLLR